MMRLKSSTKTAGFTLIEAMVVLAVMGIIAAIAWPQYQAQLRKQRRAEAVAALTRIDRELATYFSDNTFYTNYTINANISGGLRYYTASVNIPNASSYTISLAPTGDQVNDTECGTLTLTNIGVKGKSGSGSVAACWSGN